jgi:hypothetical protein
MSDPLIRDLVCHRAIRATDNLTPSASTMVRARHHPVAWMPQVNRYTNIVVTRLAAGMRTALKLVTIILEELRIIQDVVIRSPRNIARIEGEKPIGVCGEVICGTLGK